MSDSVRAFPTTAVPWLFDTSALVTSSDRSGKMTVSDEPVASSDDGRIGTLRVGHVEEPLRLVDGCLVRPLRESIRSQAGRIWAANALDPDVGEFLFKRVRKWRANNGALRFILKLVFTLRP